MTYAFAGCTVTKVDIPATVTVIGSSAFYDCSKLTRVNISDMPRWCNIAFADAAANPISSKTKMYLNGKQVTTLSITSDYERIGPFAFNGLVSLTSLTINAPISEIGKYAFSGCTALKTLNAKASPVEIGEYAFSGCKALTKIVFPDGLKTIEKRAFEKCSVATVIYYPVFRIQSSAQGGILYSKYADYRDGHR